MNAVARLDPQPRSVLVDMSHRYGMEPAAFEATLRATVCKGNVSREEFAAFLLVAKEYGLNPVTKELYAFPAKGGGIQPIVSIDGWARIINDHPQFDGMEFEDVRDGAELIAVTCRMYRKDRSRPIAATEYMAECKRGTDVWKQWPARMLRHKAMIQCARYAFGFSGIVDPDEYERHVSAAPVTGTQRKLHADFDEPADAVIEAEIDAILDGDTIPAHDAETGEIQEDEGFPGDKPVPGSDDDFDPETWARGIMQDSEAFENSAEIDAFFADPDAKARFEKLEAGNPTIAKELLAALRGRKKALVAREQG